MSVNKTWNNIVYSIPNTRGESGWETQLSQYLQALADNAATNIFLKQAIRKATTTPVTVSASTDCTIIVDLAGPGPSTVNLPAGADKQIFVIVDGKGDASTNNITIDANGSETIEGSLTKVIRLNRECLVLQYSSSAGDWKVIGGYVPNMVGGPASATDNAIVRFDGTTGKLVQNSQYAIVDDNGAVTFGDSVTGSSITHNFHSTAGSKPVINANVIGANECRIDLSRGGTRKWSWGTDNATDSMYFYNATITGLQISSTGAVTAGPVGTANHTLNGQVSHRYNANYGGITLQGNVTGDTSRIYAGGSSASGGNNGILEFYSSRGDSGNVILAGSFSGSGAWMFGHASSTTAYHRIQGTVNDPDFGALYVVNNNTSNANPGCLIATAATTDSTANKIVNFVRGGVAAGAIVCNGSGGVQFGTYSDERLKENFRPLEPQLEKMLAIDVMRFDFKKGGWSKNCIGTTAQKMQVIYPDCVSEGDDEAKTLSIGGWGPTEYKLVKAIQEQQSIIDGLKARIEALENP